LPARERRLVLEAVLTLATARALLAVLPFRHAIRRLGLQHRSNTDAGLTISSAAADPIIGAIGRGIGRAQRIVPFRAVCLQQACAAAVMLRRRGLAAEVHFGVTAAGDASMSAHAWSVCGGDIVTGAAGIDAHTRIAVFTT
jgi:hypothetical protein